MKNVHADRPGQIPPSLVWHLQTLLWEYPPEILAKKVLQVLHCMGFPIPIKEKIEAGNDKKVISFLIRNTIKISPVFVMIINHGPSATGLADLRLFMRSFKETDAGTGILISTTEFTRYVRVPQTIDLIDGKDLVQRMFHCKIPILPYFQYLKIHQGSIPILP